MKPLEGTSVVDLSTVGPGARCTSLLRDLGASLTKVLPPAGRGIEPPPFAYGGSRGTTSVRIDLKSSLEEFMGLCEAADVMVESYRPGVAARLGIGYPEVRARNERIVYCSITGYGQDGPYSGWAGHDLNYLAMGGYLACQQRGPGLPGATIADAAGGGMQAALRITAALYERERTGRGAYIDVSTTEGVVWLMSLYVDEYLATGNETRPGNSLLTGKYACYDVYRAGDGRFVAVGAIEKVFFSNLCRELGLPELAGHQYDDERQDEIRDALRAEFAKRDRDDWVSLLAAKDTCVAPVLSIAEVAGAFGKK